MKKIFYILLLTAITLQGQTTGVTRLRINANPEKTTAPRVLVQEANGDVGYVAKSSIQTDISGKENTIPTGTTSQYFRGDKTWQTLNKAAVELGNVDNTSDLNKPISTDTQAALNTKQNIVPVLEFNSVDASIWNNGKGNHIQSTSFGDKALSSNTTGGVNTAFGFSALSFNTTGGINTAVGNNALMGNTTGSLNTAVGGSALMANSSGGNNVAFGYNSLMANNAGSSNTAIGSHALVLVNGGQENVAIGSYAGGRIANGTQTGLANNSVFIGSDSKPLNNNETNQIVIGKDAIGHGSNTVTLGNTSITTTRLRGVVQGGSFVVDGGTSSQFLKADGSVDSNVYTLDNSVVKLTGNQTISGNKTFTNDIITTGQQFKINIRPGSVGGLTFASSNGINGWGISTATLENGQLDDYFDIGANTGYIVRFNRARNARFFGSVGIGDMDPSYQLQLSTDSAAKPSTNTWTIASDSRLKENVQNYTKGLDKILAIRPVTYDYNGKAGFSKITGNIGVIAQEIQSVVPEGVSTFSAKLNPTDTQDTTLYNFNSHALTYILINAVKELNQKIIALEAEVQSLKK